MNLAQSTAPTEHAITYDQAAEHLHLLDDSERSIVEGLIATAEHMAEVFTDRALITQTFKLYFDAVPADSFIELPRPPLQSVTSVTYQDVDNATQTFATSQYAVSTTSEPGRIVLQPTSTGWPSTYSGGIDVVTVEFIAGYGLAPAVPAAIKQAMLMMIDHMYTHRSDFINFTSGSFKKVPQSSTWLLMPYRMPSF